MGFLLFCFCVINWYLKNKKQQKKHDYCLQTEKKNHCFLYYWDPKSRLCKAGIGFKLFLCRGRRVLCSFSSRGRVHKLRCAAINFVYFHNFNCSKLHYILQSVYVFHFNFFNTKRGSIHLQVCWNSSYFFMWFIGMGNLLLRTKCRQQIHFIWTG